MSGKPKTECFVSEGWRLESSRLVTAIIHRIHCGRLMPTSCQVDARKGYQLTCGGQRPALPVQSLLEESNLTLCVGVHVGLEPPRLPKGQEQCVDQLTSCRRPANSGSHDDIDSSLLIRCPVNRDVGVAVRVSARGKCSCELTMRRSRASMKERGDRRTHRSQHWPVAWSPDPLTSCRVKALRGFQKEFRNVARVFCRHDIDAVSYTLSASTIPGVDACPLCRTACCPNPSRSFRPCS